MGRVMSLAQIGFTRDLDVNELKGLVKPDTLLTGAGYPGPSPSGYSDNTDSFDPAKHRFTVDTSRRSSCVGTGGNFKVASSNKISSSWRTLPLPPQSLSTAERSKGGRHKYPNTPLSFAWYQSGNECVWFVGLLCR